MAQVPLTPSGLPHLPHRYRGRSFDIRSRAEGEGEVTTDFAKLLAELGGANCDYELGEVAS